MIDFKLDQNSSVPFYRQIIDQVRCGIASNRLSPGEQLPTVRDLAVTLQVNPNTIRKAYSDMEILGILYTQQGTGTFVGHNRIQMDDKDKERILNQISNEVLSQAYQYNITKEELISYLNTL
jgi:GntR family transcriptional regulator